MRIPLASSFESCDRTARRFRRYKKIAPIMDDQPLSNESVMVSNAPLISFLQSRADSIVSNSTNVSMMPFLDSKTKPMCRGRSQSTGFISLIEDTADGYQRIRMAHV